MRRYKFQTNEDVVELLRNLVEDVGVVFLTSFKDETPEEAADSVINMVLAGGYVGTFAMTFTIVELYLVCFTHKTIT